MVTRLLILTVLVSAIQCFEGARGEIFLLFQVLTYVLTYLFHSVKNYGPLILPYFFLLFLAIFREID